MTTLKCKTKEDYVELGRTDKAESKAEYYILFK